MLQVRLREGFGEPVDLVAPGCTVGRGSVNDIVIDSSEVAPFHADIKVTAKSVTIADTGTETGTFVNGRRVITPATLKSGDTVRVGDVELVIESKFRAIKTVELKATGLVELGSGSWALVAESGPDAGSRLPITGKMDIGRSSSCAISVFNPGLSRRHAEFFLHDDQLHVRDLGSANGTWVNDRQVSETGLEDGDSIRFDNLIFTVIAPR